MVDRFPEAFERFEQVVDIYSFESYRELAYSFIHWASGRWVDSCLQNLALKREVEKRGFRVRDAKTPIYFENQHRAFATRTWRHETVTVRGKPQGRYRDLGTGRFIKKP
jgi:hypothetical protein